MTARGRLPDAVVFDCDGTLVDTETLSRSTIASTLVEMGHRRLEDRDFLAMVGHAWPTISAYLRDEMGVADIDDYRRRVNRAFSDRFDEVVPFADTVEVARQLVEAGVPIGVCTSSGRESLDRVLAMPGIAGLAVAASVAREDTTLHKPDPAPYLLTASRLRVDPGACVAVEDSPTGAASAVAAGMRVVVVDRGNHQPDEFAALGLTPVSPLTLEHLVG